MRWRAPVLEVRHPVERDLHLQGRGLRLVPSFFCGATPLPLVEQDLPVLVYPIAPEHRRDAIADPGDSAPADNSIRPGHGLAVLLS